MKCNTANWKRILITLLRVAIGWHFLYEGITKLSTPGWTSYGYLSNTSGFLSGFYHSLASNPSVVGVVDFFNMWGLTAIGLALFLGVFLRYAMVGGILLLLLYYFAYPPVGSSLLKVSDGQFLFVDRNLMEALTLLVFLFLREKGYGIGRWWLLSRKKAGPVVQEEEIPEESEQYNPRRELLKNMATLPLLGALGWSAYQTQRRFGIDTLSGATIKLKTADLRKLEGELPM